MTNPTEDRESGSYNIGVRTPPREKIQIPTAWALFLNMAKSP